MDRMVGRLMYGPMDNLTGIWVYRSMDRMVGGLMYGSIDNLVGR